VQLGYRREERERERESVKRLAEDASLSRISEKPISNPIPASRKRLTAFIAECISDAENTDVHTGRYQMREMCRSGPLSLSSPILLFPLFAL